MNVKWNVTLGEGGLWHALHVRKKMNPTMDDIRVCLGHFMPQT
jgi:hypothetical protein